MRTWYEVREKEKKITQLTEMNRYQKRILYLCVFLCVLLVAGLLFFNRFLQLKRKNAINLLEITRLEKTEAEVQIQLKEEMLKRSELEKYEALLDIHFKEKELTEQEQELKSLFRQKEMLEEQIIEQAKILENREIQPEKIQTRLNSQSISGFKDEMKQQIRSRLKSTVYIRKVDEMDDALLINLEKLSAGKLSPLYIRYCICFIIGMSIKDVADCFCVEVSTVHIIRHRLKQRLKLNKDEDLDVYFKNLRK